MQHGPQSDRRLALAATRHCLTGCAIGEVLGMVIGTAGGLGNGVTVLISVALAFLFGYGLTFVPLLRGGMALPQAFRLALAADTISITIMEIVDNAVMVFVPGAMDAGLDDPFFWGTLAVSLALAFAAAYPANLWLVSRGSGHARMHAHH